MKHKLKAKLILEDGSEFIGDSFGAHRESLGEVVFNTGMTGYQEILSDPSYCGQMVTMTYPLIGNYGINKDDFESMRPFVHGFIVREYCESPSNWRSLYSLDELLKEFDIPAIQGVDTRKLTRILRNHGTMKGIIVPGISIDGKFIAGTFKEDVFVAGLAKAQYSNLKLEEKDKLDKTIDQLNKLAKDRLKNPLMMNQVEVVSTKSAFTCPGDGYRVVLVDYGYKQGILKALINKGCDVVVVPHDASFAEIDRLKPDGVLLSNGPGDPKDVVQALELIPQIQKKYPLFGICMGHQVFALANGADTHKMKFGHRGCNHPVKDLETDKVYISSQNHGYEVSDESIANTELEVSFINVNDNTVEGLKHSKYPAFSVQFHPEALPGPRDSAFLFEKFFEMIESYIANGRSVIASTAQQSNQNKSKREASHA